MSPRYSETFFAHGGRVSDKWEQYLSIYDREFAPFIAAGKPVRLLEIGVQNGGSLEIWNALLPAGSTIIGIDINNECAKLKFNTPNISVMIGDASDPAVLDAILKDTEFDIILDDGSHLCRHVIATFQACFRRLKNGGIYIVEDLHTSYWAEFGGGFRTPEASIEWLKGLVDAQHTDYFQNAESIPDVSDLRDLNRLVRRVTFYDSVAVIEKWQTPKEAPHKRVITGTNAAIIEPAYVAELELPGSHLDIMLTTQALNSTVKKLRHEHDCTRAELAIERENLIIEMKKLANAESRIKELENHLQQMCNSTSWRITAPLREIFRFFRK